MTDDVDARGFRVDPSVPHGLQCIEKVFGNAHGIRSAASPVVFHTAEVGVAVGEDDFDTSRANPESRTRTLAPVIVPASDVLDGKRILVLVVSPCVYLLLYFIGNGGLIGFGAFPLLVIRVTVIVPILAERFIPAIFRSPHRVVCTLIDIKHFPAVFGFADIQHFAWTYGTSSVWVILVAYGFHLQHVLAADGFVTRFVEQDTRIVTIVDDGIAHQFGALFPLASFPVFLRVAGGHGLDKAYTVARFHILLPGSDVHPAYQIGITLYHQAIAVIAQPGGNGDTQSGPLVAGALCESFHL